MDKETKLTDEWFNMGFRHGVRETFDYFKYQCKHWDNHTLKCIHEQSFSGVCSLESCPVMKSTYKYMQDTIYKTEVVK